MAAFWVSFRVRFGVHFGVIFGSVPDLFWDPFRGSFCNKTQAKQNVSGVWVVLKGDDLGSPFDPISGYLFGNNFGVFLEPFLDTIFGAWPSPAHP